MANKIKEDIYTELSKMNKAKGRNTHETLTSAKISDGRIEATNGLMLVRHSDESYQDDGRKDFPDTDHLFTESHFEHFVTFDLSVIKTLKEIVTFYKKLKQSYIMITFDAKNQTVATIGKQDFIPTYTGKPLEVKSPLPYLSHDDFDTLTVSFSPQLFEQVLMFFIKQKVDVVKIDLPHDMHMPVKFSNDEYKIEYILMPMRIGN